MLLDEAVINEVTIDETTEDEPNEPSRPNQADRPNQSDRPKQPDRAIQSDRPKRPVGSIFARSFGKVQAFLNSKLIGEAKEGELNVTIKFPITEKYSELKIGQLGSKAIIKFNHFEMVSCELDANGNIGKSNF